jgi:hypothetical protein
LNCQTRIKRKNIFKRYKIMDSALTFNTKRSFTAKQVFGEFVDYLRKPLYIAEDASMSKTEKFQYLYKVLLCKLALLPILVPIIYFSKEFTEAKFIEYKDTWMMYFAVVALAPIIEESLFRGVLRYSRWSISIAISLLIGFLIELTGANDLIDLHIGFIYLACFILIPIIFTFTEQFDGFLRVFWAKYFVFIFHFIAISFGLIHLTNYTNINNYFFALPLVTSQIILGYVLGFVRMKFGLGYSMAFHAAWNFIAGFGLLIVLVDKLF